MKDRVTFPVSPHVERGDPSLHRRIEAVQSIQDSSGVTLEASGSDADGLLVDDRGSDQATSAERQRQRALGRRRVSKLANGLLRAVHLAYADHFPLVLSPDDVWLAIAQGFASHVNAHAEQFRGRFVAHAGQKLLSVVRDSFVPGYAGNDWPGVFAEFSDQIASHVGDANRRMVVADFSTTTPVSRAASEIVLLDAMKAYFGYEVRTMCGIPEVTLLGTRDDWRDVQHRARALGDSSEAVDWGAAVSGVLDHFVRAHAGDADPRFWQALYKPAGGSGGPFVTGWVNVLFPYLPDHVTGGNTRPNRLALHRDWAAADPHDHHASNSGDFPSGLSSVPFVWDYHGQPINMSFLGGFSGVSQDPESGAVRPVIGWGVATRPGGGGRG